MFACYGLYCRLVHRKKHDNPVDLVYFSCMLVSKVCLAATSLLRATRPFETIGNDVAVTVLLSAGWLLGTTQGGLLAYKWLVATSKFLVSPELKAQLVAFRRYWLAVALLPFVFATTGVYTAMLFYHDYASKYALTTVQLLSLASAFALFFVPCMLFVFNPMITAVEQSIATQKQIASADTSVMALAESLAKFKLLRNSSAVFMLGCVALMVPVALVPVLNRAGPSYLNPLQLTCWEAMCVYGTATFLRRSDIDRLPGIVRVAYYKLVQQSSNQPSQDAGKSASTSRPSAAAVGDDRSMPRDVAVVSPGTL